MRDRYLFSADRKSSEYRGVLEITPGRARLLTPSQSAMNVRWTVSIGLSIAYIAVGTWLLSSLVRAPIPAAPLGWIVLVAAFVVWFAGYFAVFLWWDRRSLPILADGPSRWLDLILLGARSFGTFQDVRARTIDGNELHLVVDARAPRFWDAVKLLEGKPFASG